MHLLREDACCDKGAVRVPCAVLECSVRALQAPEGHGVCCQHTIPGHCWLMCLSGVSLLAVPVPCPACCCLVRMACSMRNSHLAYIWHAASSWVLGKYTGSWK